MIERLGGDHGMVELKHDRVVLFFRSIWQVIDTAEWLELPATVSAAKRAQVLVGRLARSDRVLISRPVGREIVAAAHQMTESMSAELEKHHTYVVMPREGLMLDQGPGAFGSELLDMFPEVRQDVSAAAHCRAYELWTACIVHLMRVAEVGIGRLADHVGAPRGNSWGATAANLSKALESAQGRWRWQCQAMAVRGRHLSQFRQERLPQPGNASRQELRSRAGDRDLRQYPQLHAADRRAARAMTRGWRDSGSAA